MNNNLFLATLLLFVFFSTGTAQTYRVYNPELDGMQQLQEAIKQADAQNKHVFMQIGGNWCPLCLRFKKFYTEDAELDSLLNTNYVPIYISYGGDNRNLELLAEMGIPQRFGFPVVVITDAQGNRLHTQDTGYLEENGELNREKVLRFFHNWRPEALDQKNNR